MEILILIVWLALCGAAAYIAASKGRSGVGIFFLAFLLSPLVGIIVAFALSPNSEKVAIAQGKKKCPNCAEFVQPDAKTCRFCQHSFVEEEAAERKLLEAEQAKRKAEYDAQLVAEAAAEAAKPWIQRHWGGLAVLALLVCSLGGTAWYGIRHPLQLPTTSGARPEPGPQELLTARAAFQKLFVAARNYALDIKPFRIESTPKTDDNGNDGKSAIWSASFASAKRRGMKSFIWSGSNAPDAPSRGVSPGREDVYNPSNSSLRVFDVALLKIDSDQAFVVAQKHGGDKVLEEDSSTPVTYVCDWNPNSNALIWHVIYGPSRADAKLAVAVNASSGRFIRVEN